MNFESKSEGKNIQSGCKKIEPVLLNLQIKIFYNVMSCSAAHWDEH